MASISWRSGQSGTWTDPAAWSGGGVPGPGDDVILSAAPTGPAGYTVLLSTHASIHSVTQTQPVATLDVEGGTLALAGTYGLGAGTLALEGGTLAGGTLVTAGGTLVAGPGSMPGDPLTDTLSALTVRGRLLLDTSYGGVQVTGGLTVAGSSSAPGAIGIEGNSDTLSIGGTQTLDYLSIGIGDPTPEYLGDALFADGPGGQTSTLTLGAHATVVQTGAAAELAGAGERGLVINHGSITAGVAGGTFTLRSLANAGRLAVEAGAQAVLADIGNSGTITDAGGLVSVQGSLLNTGLISIAGAGAAYQADPYTIPGLINEGVFRVSGGATASLGLYGYGWTNAGTLAVAGGLLSVGGNFSIAQLGHISLSAGGTLGFYGTLTNAGTLGIGAGTDLPLLALQAGGDIAGGVVADAGGGLLAQGGTLAGVMYQGVLSLSGTGALATVAGGLTLIGAAGTGPGSLMLTGIGACLVWDSAQALDHATLSIGASGPRSFAAGAAPAILAASGGPAVQLGAQLRIQQAGAAARIGSTAGTFSSAATITANVAGGQFTLGGERFTSTGTIGISGGDSVAAASTGFFNAGLIVVGIGSVLDLNLANYVASGSPAGRSFSNTGTVQMAGGTLAELTAGRTFPNVPLLNTGDIAGAGVVASQIDNGGVVEARGGILNLVQTVSGTGALRIDGGSMLVLGGVGTGQTATFNGMGGVLGLQPAYFLGKIGGFAAGDTLDLFDTSAQSAGFSGGMLDVVLTDDKHLYFATTLPESGSLTVAAGKHGDSLVRFAPMQPYTHVSEGSPPSWLPSHH